MADDGIFEKSLRQQRLWPTIHGAVDAYLRRKECKADYYELIWRLIHIWECAIVTLSAAAAARYRSSDNSDVGRWLLIRERCHGITWDEGDETLNEGVGALGGSIDKWIEVLRVAADDASSTSGFIQCLRRFLRCTDIEEGCEIGIELDSLFVPWRLTCDAPRLNKTKVSVLDAFKLINSFRNRFAHVPFPYDRLRELSEALEDCTYQLFNIQSPTSSENVPLVGSLALGDCTLRGSSFGKRSKTIVEAEHFVWGADQGSGSEVWDARPFIHLDQMMRPYLLTRLLNQAGLWEYTRYLAEAGAIKTITAPNLTCFLPAPTTDDYKASSLSEPSIEDEQGQSIASKQRVETREEALIAFRAGDFEAAIDFWKNELKTHKDYHSGWQRLGMAQREWAARLAGTDEGKACHLLADSIESFLEATKHREPQFAAEAFYNRSKAQWRLWKLTEHDDYLNEAMGDVAMALKQFYAERYVSWMEFLDRESLEDDDNEMRQTRTVPR